MLRRRPEEVLGMWSDALRILDENTMKLYVEELEKSFRMRWKQINWKRPEARKCSVR